jgi:hypothetical protein
MKPLLASVLLRLTVMTERDDARMMVIKVLPMVSDIAAILLNFAVQVVVMAREMLATMKGTVMLRANIAM